LPRRRFVHPPISAKASDYVGTEQSYRQSVKAEGMPIMYDDRNAVGRKVPQGLAPSTVWRWLTWMGGMPGTLRAAWDLIRQKEPNSTLHRQPWAVPAAKYRSPKRRETLMVAMQVLAVDRICGRIFGKGIFPRYATGGDGP
jgi:hypothetical protein